MSDTPPPVIEQLRLALLSDTRAVADTLLSISDSVDAELGDPTPNLEDAQSRFIETATRLEVCTRLREKIGWPGEPVAPDVLALCDHEERTVALEVLFRYRAQLDSQAAATSDASELLAEFSLIVAQHDPISVRRIATG